MQSKTIHRRNRAQLSCDRCRRIKRQCSRSAPCSRCTHDKVECTWAKAKISSSILAKSGKAWSQISNSEPDGTLASDRKRMIQDHQSIASSSTSCAVSQEHSEAIWNLIEQTTFMKQVLELYTNEIDWIWDLIKDSRLERLIRSHDDFVARQRNIWDQVKVFAIAIVAITAQLCPTDVEAVLVCLDAEPHSSASFALHTATSIMDAAYAETNRLIDAIAESEPSASRVSVKKRTWPAEIFAASYLLRNVEKNKGAYRKQLEGLAIDVTRLHHAGYVRQPCRPCEMSKQWMIAEREFEADDWPMNHTALAHNVFWAYYTLDRLSNVSAGSTYLIQAKNCDLCLNDVFGHTHVTRLNELSTAHSPTLMRCTTGATDDHPVQSAYQGAKCRFAAVASHFIDRMIDVRSPTFNWPADAEHLIKDLERDLHVFDTFILPTLDDASDRFSKAKKLTLALCVELLRTSITAQIHICFAATLFQRSLSSSPVTPAARQSIEWEMERRKLDSAKALIARVLPYSQAALQLRSSWPFFAMSVFCQVDTILDSLQARSDEARAGRQPSADEKCQAQLGEYFHYAIKGRNFLTLLGRNSDLPLTKSYITITCNKMTNVLRSLYIDHDRDSILDKRRIVDEHALVKMVQARFYAPPSASTNEQSNYEPITFSAAATFNPYPTPPDDISPTSLDALPASDMAWNSIFTDLAELERLFLIPENQSGDQV